MQGQKVKKMTAQDVLEQIRHLANEVVPQYGHVILYGSRARGDAREDSDWDLLILLDKPTIEQRDYDEIVYPLTALGWDLEEMIIPVIYTQKEWRKSRFTPFYKNVKREGVPLR